MGVFSQRWLFSTVSAEVPIEYQANYGIAQIWDNVMQDFIQIQAKKKVGDTPDTSTFSRLSNNFSIIFPKLPQKNNYKIVFEQCLLLSNKLAIAYSNINFDIFVDQCQWPINSIMKEINNNYSVKAKIKASPNAGSAPLTVTFDARESFDPSKDTIPANNFFWYYKDNKGNDILIGKQSVVKHTFEEEGNYLIHLTARSSNNKNDGILDGEATVSVNVSPETANLIVYANGKKLQQKTYTKLWTFEAQRGIVFDASPSQPKGGRQIMSHNWEINGANGFRYKSEEFQTKPGSVTVKIPNNGAYTVTLKTTDNENNITSKNYLIAISDPIAIINKNTENITSSTIVRFDGSASYSIQSRLKKYSWEVFDEKGEKIYAIQTRDFSKKFDKPGTYTVNLKVTDELGQSNEESQTVFVDSTEPQAQFTITPRLDRDQPSQFILDAGGSSDKDVTDGNDSLTYERSFSNSSQSKIEQSYDNNKSIVVSFEDPGVYKAKLIVSDSYGKINTLEKEITVESSLRPIVYISPRATVRWQNITFIVKANDDIVYYDWDFGDGTKSRLQEGVTKKSFTKAWIYNVKLTATSKRNQTNSVTTQVFIGEKNAPIGAYTITNSKQNILKPTETCSWENAFPIKRLEKFKIDISESVNVKWEKKDLNSFFQPMNDEIYRRNDFQYQFKKVWCEYVDMIIEDTVTTKSDRKRIWFKVTNDLPILRSISLNFPQFGNEVGVGISQWSKEKTFDPTKVNPLIVKVNAIWPKDNDGFITQYVWYYYKKDDPSRKIELKPTPANTPSAYFSIFSEPGEIVFGVKLIDNDWAEQASEAVIGQWPTIFIPPQWDGNIDIPIISLLVNKVNVSVWEEVTFTTKARILSNRPDFDAKKTIEYDFDGDGIWDKSTKENSVKYTYTKDYPDGIRPRIRVTYRRFPVETNGDLITVNEDLKPIPQFAVYDKTVLFRDYSYGRIKTRSLCFDGKISCKKEEIIYTGAYAEHTYANYGQYMAVLSLSDQYGNNATNRQIINITKTETWNDPYPLSLPQTNKKDGAYAISVGEQSKNAVLLNIVNPKGDVCYFDKDINEDSNNDGKPDNDNDLPCNETALINYTPTTQTIIARIIFKDIVNGKTALVSNDMYINFIDQKINLSPAQDALYKKIKTLESSIAGGNEGQKNLKIFLKQLGESVITDRDATDIVLQIRDLLQETPPSLDTNQQKALENILQEMSSGEAIAAMGGSLYDQAKASLVQFSPEQIKWQIRGIFDKIEAIDTPGSQPETIKWYLTELIGVFQKNSVPDSDINQPGNETKIQEGDIETVVMPEVCKILWFYNISSDQCRPIDEWGDSDISQGLSTDKTTSGSFWITTIVKRVGIVVGILAGIFILIVIFFAIKAKIQSNNDETEEQTTPTQ